MAITSLYASRSSLIWVCAVWNSILDLTFISQTMQREPSTLKIWNQIMMTLSWLSTVFQNQAVSMRRSDQLFFTFLIMLLSKNGQGSLLPKILTTLTPSFSQTVVVRNFAILQEFCSISLCIAINFSNSDKRKEIFYKPATLYMRVLTMNFKI